MKKYYAFSLMLFLSGLSIMVSAQSSGAGQGGDFTPTHLCLPESEREQIKQHLQENIRLLGLDQQPSSRAIDDLKFPLRMPTAIPGYFHYQAVSGYVDHNPLSGTLDYNCEDKTYNGHMGSDYYTFPFPFYLYTNDLVEVIAAAPGVIISKQDGNSDVNCSPSGNWNAVYIRHADGSVMWYGHLKNGSLTTKNLGDAVAEGEYLGILASSGYSTGPHLHIEYYDGNGNLLDPYQGSCNESVDNSLWDEQAPHTVPKVNAVLTHSSNPNVSCGINTEAVDFVNEFYAGERTIVAVYITDYQAGTVATTRVLRPNGTQYATFNTFNSQNSYGWFWNSRNYWLNVDDPEGQWTVECTYEGVTYTHTFEFRHEVTSVSGINEEQWSIAPNPTNGEIIISGDNWQNQPYRLINGLGQELERGVLNQQKINLEHLSTGLYYLMIGEGQHTLVEKVIKT